MPQRIGHTRYIKRDLHSRIHTFCMYPFVTHMTSKEDVMTEGPEEVFSMDFVKRFQPELASQIEESIKRRKVAYWDKKITLLVWKGEDEVFGDSIGDWPVPVFCDLPSQNGLCLHPL
jgi:hypothetical protein